MKKLLFLILLLIPTLCIGQVKLDTITDCRDSKATCYQPSEQIARMGIATTMGGGMTAAVACTAGGPTEAAIVDRTDVGTDYYPLIAQSVDYTAYMRLSLGASTYTITKYILYAKDSSQTGGIIGSLYSSAGVPGSETISTIIADTSVTVDHAAISDHPTFADATFTLTTPKTGQTGTIWVGFVWSGASAYFATVANDDVGYRAWTNDLGYRNDTSLGVAVYGCSE